MGVGKEMKNKGLRIGSCCREGNAEGRMEETGKKERNKERRMVKKEKQRVEVVAM